MVAFQLAASFLTCLLASAITLYLYGEGHDKEPHLIARDLRENLRRRNPSDPISWRAVKPTSPKILVQDLTGLGSADTFGAKYPAS
jgi:hypothetical protein